MTAITKESQTRRPRYKREKRVVRETVAVKICRDGREVCNLRTTLGRAVYRERIELMLERQGFKCGIGKEGLTSEAATFDHEVGRGMGGGFRDDRIVKDGQEINRAVCLKHNILKGSRRGY